MLRRAPDGCCKAGNGIRQPWSINRAFRSARKSSACELLGPDSEVRGRLGRLPGD